MKTFDCHAVVTGSKYLGTVEAASEEEAKEKAFNLETAGVSLCWHCAGECENPEVTEIEVIEKEEA